MKRVKEYLIDYLSDFSILERVLIVLIVMFVATTWTMLVSHMIQNGVQQILIKQA